MLYNIIEQDYEGIIIITDDRKQKTVPLVILLLFHIIHLKRPVLRRPGFTYFLFS